MSRAERAAEGYQASMAERKEAWAIVEASADTSTGYVPIEVIDELLATGGMKAVVGNDAIQYVDPEILQKAIDEETEE